MCEKNIAIVVILKLQDETKPNFLKTGFRVSSKVVKKILIWILALI